MSTKTRKRPKNTRTNRLNARPALPLSTLPINHIGLRTIPTTNQPVLNRLVCPDCRTWVPVTKHRDPHRDLKKLAPHDSAPAGHLNPTPCRLGSNRLIDLDLTAEHQQSRLDEAERDAADRRPTRINPKPRTTTPPPASHINPTPPPARAPRHERARRALTAHQTTCRTCRPHHRCPTGQTLAKHLNQTLAEQHAYEKTDRRNQARARAKQWNRNTPATTTSGHPRQDLRGPDLTTHTIHRP